jgi:hypothetical protein
MMLLALARQIRSLSSQLGFLSLAALLRGGGTPGVDTFPTVRCSASGTSGGDTTSYSPSIGGTAAAGDLILVQAATDSPGSETPSIAGYSQIGSTESATDFDVKFFGKVATGGETTVTITHSASEEGAYSILVVAAGTWDGSVSNVAISAASENTNCPTVTPPWGGRQNLFAGFLVCHPSRSVTSYPSDLPDNRSYGADANDVTSAVATAGQFATLMDPGSFTLSAGGTIRTFTVAVAPHASMTGMSIAASSSNTEWADTTTHDITIPGSPTAGQLLLAFAATDGAETFTAPSGWQTLVEDAPDSGSAGSCAIFWTEALGSESGTVTFATGTAEKSASKCFLIDGWNGNTPDFTATGPVSTSTPDPPAVSGLGTGEKIIFAAAAIGRGDFTVSSYPAGATSGESVKAGSDNSGAMVSLALFHGYEQSYDPGVYTLSSGTETFAFSVAVRAA